MSTKYHQPAPVTRKCALCGELHTVYPLDEKHRRAHLTQELAFVCTACAGLVRLQVEAASAAAGSGPRVSA